ncbi:two-component system sensor histidine kinase CreC [Leptospira sp. GIMC2001]|uniref:two-component system sensor histidine kinase CreC n=1 Tax=Leptospira sp. GIMC2001 TaxID=1513297 RepID=UPI00234B07DB|nr:two-component system sensor histidine kinase CreC [Leptospira sp. GIMC2001]WCL51383.1 two-component system sensor histidine kinase CreC [Leptospira sp. GIMC2001]
MLILGFYYLINKTIDTIRPQYLETVEESINDTSNVLSSLIEVDLQKKNTPITDKVLQKSIRDNLFPVLAKAKSRKFQAKIYSFTKTQVDIQVYATDKNGIVIFDSEGFREGLDYSKFNDVHLTLQDKYGARSSLIKAGEDSSALFIASPIRFNQSIVGVITVIKPKDNIAVFIDLAKAKFYQASIYVAIFIAILFLILVLITLRPISKLSRYVKGIRNQEKIQFPKINIPEIRLLGQEMDRLIEELDGKKYIENYTQTLTHELKSPLSSIIASSELLESDLPMNKQLSLISNIQTEGKRIQEIIDRLLDLASLENNKNINLKEEINIKNTIEDCINSCEPELTKKRIQVISKLENKFILGNIFYFRLTIMNLLKNAIDFTKQNGKIQISLEEKSNKTWELIIWNESTPIEPYALEKIFDRFYSMPRPDTGRKSSGLGLSLVKQVCSIHGFKIEIQNENSGVQAKIIFPIS